jgi:hypothetical protein
VRPFLVSPDLIFRDASKRHVLVEVKAMLDTGRAGAQRVSTAIEVLELMAKTRLIRRYRYTGYVITVRILAADRYELDRLALEE